jgi:hypothetical protein
MHGAWQVLDAEGVLADSVALTVQPLEVLIAFQSPEGRHQAAVQLAHPIIPEESRAEVGDSRVR